MQKIRIHPVIKILAVLALAVTYANIVPAWDSGLEPGAAYFAVIGYRLSAWLCGYVAYRLLLAAVNASQRRYSYH